MSIQSAATSSPASSPPPLSPSTNQRDDLFVPAVIVSLLLGALFREVFQRLIGALSIQMARLWRWGSDRAAPHLSLGLTLRRYSAAVMRSDLAKMENPVGPPLDVPLERAFAPLRLMTGSGKDVDLFSYVTEENRFIVLGVPGSGKTTIMKNLLVTMLHGHAGDALRQVIPVFVSLRTLAQEAHTVEDAVVAALTPFVSGGAPKLVQSARRQGRLLVILDGLDEVGAAREDVVAKILHFCTTDSVHPMENRVIVTCRESSYRAHDLSSHFRDIVRVAPFQNRDMQKFLEGWPRYPSHAATDLYPLIEADPQLFETCRNPLLLTILAGLYLELGPMEFVVPSSRDKFYGEALDELLLQRPTRRGIRQTFRHSDKATILQRACLEALEREDPLRDPETFSLGDLERHAESVLGLKGRARDLVQELIDVNGLLRTVDDSSYTLAHRTIQEYLAAREAALSRTATDVLETLGAHNHLAEILYFYCAIIRNVPQLEIVLGALIKSGDLRKAARCLANMRELPGETLVRAIVDGLWKTGDAPTLPTIELLLPLSYRRDARLQYARDRLAEATSVILGNFEGDSTQVARALGRSPDVAERLLPALLSHEAEAARIAAIRLLYDLGSEKAVDTLMQTLRKESGSGQGGGRWGTLGDAGQSRRFCEGQGVHLPNPTRPSDLADRQGPACISRDPDRGGPHGLSGLVSKQGDSMRAQGCDGYGGTSRREVSTPVALGAPVEVAS